MFPLLLAPVEFWPKTIIYLTVIFYSGHSERVSNKEWTVMAAAFMFCTRREDYKTISST